MKKYKIGNPFHVDYELELKCVNRTKRNIQIDKVGIKIDKKPIYPNESIFPKFSPKLLIDGQGITVTFDIVKLVEGLSNYKGNITSIQGFVIDAFEKRYDSKKIPFDVDNLFNHYQARQKIGDKFLA